MKIGIIGSGNIGSTPAWAGHSLRAPTERVRRNDEQKMVKEFLALGDKLTTEDIVRLDRAASA